MEERRVQVDRVVMPASLLANVQHPGTAQVADQTPDGSPGKGQGFGDVTDRAVRIDRNVENDSAMAGDEIEVFD